MNIFSCEYQKRAEKKTKFVAYKSTFRKNIFCALFFVFLLSRSIYSQTYYFPICFSGENTRDLSVIPGLSCLFGYLWGSTTVNIDYVMNSSGAVAPASTLPGNITRVGTFTVQGNRNYYLTIEDFGSIIYYSGSNPALPHVKDILFQMKESSPPTPADPVYPRSPHFEHLQLTTNKDAYFTYFGTFVVPLNTPQNNYYIHKSITITVAP